MARRKKSPTVTASPTLTTVTMKVAVISRPETPTYYVNHAEIGFTPHEFTVMVARIPPKLAPEAIEVVTKQGTLTLDAELQLVIPPTLVPGLIRALTISKEQYEKVTGIAIKDVGAGT
jgi:hypothetical protein